MRTIAMTFAVSIALLGGAPTFAAEDMQSAGVSLEAAMAQNQAAAIHSGDELLTCKQLQAEMTSTMSDPAMQAQMQTMGTQAQAMQDRAKQAQAGMKTQMAVGMATGIASSFVPGLGYAQAIAMQAQAAQQKKQGEAGQRDMANMLNGMQSVMPQMMRGQRLYELAQTQKCAFIEGPPQSAPAN